MPRPDSKKSTIKFKGIEIGYKKLYEKRHIGNEIGNKFKRLTRVLITLQLFQYTPASSYRMKARTPATAAAAEKIPPDMREAAPVNMTP